MAEADSLPALTDATQAAKACSSCKIIGASVFYASSAYMAIEGLRNSSYRTRIFYSLASITLAGLGSYRLLKPLGQLDSSDSGS